MILARQTFSDRSVERAAEVAIECIGVDEPRPGVSPSAVPNQLLGAAMYAISAASWFVDWVSPWRDEPNQLHFLDPEYHRLVGGDPNIVFQLGAWELGPDEALVIDVTPPVCANWNIQLRNIWAECLDKRRRISVNHVTVAYELDGSVRLVVAERNPGHLNWIDTTGHEHGIMDMRWVRAETHPAASTRVVPLADSMRER